MLRRKFEQDVTGRTRGCSSARRRTSTYLTPAIEDRGVEVQMLLADRGQHRAPSIPDLLIAATAEKVG